MFTFFYIDITISQNYTLSLHDALPIWIVAPGRAAAVGAAVMAHLAGDRGWDLCDWEQLPAGSPLLAWPAPEGCLDRKSTRLNSSHVRIPYAVFFLNKKTLILSIGFI